MITAKINCTRIDKKYLYAGKNGKYLDLVIFENKDGPDQYGNTHMVIQGIPKEARDRGERGPIIGNLRLESQSSRPTQQRQPARQTPETPQEEPEGDIPF